MPDRLNSYLGLHAARYDLIYADKPYLAEAAFVANLAGARSGRLLDVACGTGRHAREFAALGFDVTGVDYNEDLLAVARAAVAPGVSFQHGDMRSLPAPAEPYDVVTCLFDSIGYALDDDAIVAALQSLAGQLAPDGVLVVEFLHASAFLAAASPTRVRRWATPEGGELLRISETELDRVNGTMTVAYELIELSADGDVSRDGECQRNRFFTLAEMRLLLRVAGVELDRLVPAYEDGEVSSETWHVLAVARAGRS